MARPLMVFECPVQHTSIGWHLRSYTDRFFNLDFIFGEPTGHHKYLLINDIRSDKVVTVALILVIRLILSSPTFDNIYWLLDMKHEDLCPLHHPSSQSSISFSIKLWQYLSTLTWAAGSIIGVAFSFIFFHVPLCVVCAFTGIFKHVRVC